MSSRREQIESWLPRGLSRTRLGDSRSGALQPTPCRKKIARNAHREERAWASTPQVPWGFPDPRGTDLGRASTLCAGGRTGGGGGLDVLREGTRGQGG